MKKKPTSSEFSFVITLVYICNIQPDIHFNSSNPIKTMSYDQTQNRNQYSNLHPFYDVDYRTTSYRNSYTNYPCSQSSYLHNNYGYCVLENNGNLCFLNSIIQCLCNIPELVEYYRNYVKKQSSSNVVSTAFADLVNQMQRQNSARSNELKSALCEYAPHFQGYRQQDAHECLTVLLDALHQETPKKMNDDDEQQSIITDLFQGQMKYIITCSHVSQCGNVTNVIDPFLDIPVFVENIESISSSPTFNVRFFSIDGNERIYTIPLKTNTTIQSVIDRIRSQLSVQNRTSIVAMKISSDNTLSGQYRPTVLLSQIDEQSTVFYAIDENGSNPTTVCLFLDKNRKNLSQLYSRPPLLLKIASWEFEYKLRTFVRNHLNSSTVQFDIEREDPLIDITSTCLSPHVKTVIIKFHATTVPKVTSTKLSFQSEQNASVTLEQCLKKNILSIERMSSNNDIWFCSKCDQNRQATKRNSIISLPRVLVVHLKRFNIESTPCCSKIETFVKYPLELNMTEFLTDESNQESIYDLISVCLHTGSFESGHYITYAKKSSGWFRFSDSFISPISDNEIVSKNAYILFYLKRS